MIYSYEIELRKRPEKNYKNGEFDENFTARITLELNTPLRTGEVLTINNPSDEGFVFYEVTKLFRRVFPTKITLENNRGFEHEYYDYKDEIVSYFGHALQTTNDFV